jgi:hypothetical protein
MIKQKVSLNHGENEHQSYKKVSLNHGGKEHQSYKKVSELMFIFTMIKRDLL